MKNRTIKIAVSSLYKNAIIKERKKERKKEKEMGSADRVRENRGTC